MTRLSRHSQANVDVWRADAAARSDGAWLALDGLALHSTGIPLPYWNGAVLTEEHGLQSLPEAVDWFAARQMPWGLMIPADFDAAPPGLELVMEQPVMLRSLDDLPEAPDLELRWDAGEEASAVQAEAFETDLDLSARFVLPKLACPSGSVVVGYDGGQPVATATLFTSGGVAAVYGVGTVVNRRRSGFGYAVTLAVLHEAARLGCDLAYLNPSPMAYGVYCALGFEDAAPNRIYRTLAETDLAAV